MGSRSRLVTAIPAVFSEFTGSAVLLFVGCLGCFPSPIPIRGALAFGAALTTAIQVFGHISGGHFNPAVTLSAFFFGVVSLPRACAYTLAQLAGATAGFGLSKFVAPDFLQLRETNSTFCNTVLAPGMYLHEGFLMEFVCTFLLVLLCCSTWDKRNKDKTDSIALKFGMFLSTVVLSIGSFTGASLNPARTFAPSVINNHWDYHWVYWFAPIGGGILASILYKTFLTEKGPRMSAEKASFDQGP